MSQDFKTLPTVNGVPVSLQGHQHNFDDFQVLVAKASKTATQAYSANTTTKLTINSVVFNTGFVIDDTNDRLYIPANVSGQRIFEIRVNLDLSSTSTMYIYVYKNGVLFETPYYISTALNTHICSTMLQFAPNDYIEIYIRGGTARTINTTTTLSIKQVA